jgi:hypothetical protein
MQSKSHARVEMPQGGREEEGLGGSNSFLPFLRNLILLNRYYLA